MNRASAIKNPEQLRRCRDHSHYDFWMPLCLTNIHAPIPFCPGIISTAMHECTPVHLLTLLDYFSNKGSQGVQ